MFRASKISDLRPVLVSLTRVFHLNFFSFKIALISGSALIDPSGFFMWKRLSLMAWQCEYFHRNSNAWSNSISKSLFLIAEICYRMILLLTLPYIFAELDSWLKITKPWIELASWFERSFKFLNTNTCRSKPSNELIIN